jgi:hypothetical protein
VRVFSAAIERILEKICFRFLSSHRQSDYTDDRNGGKRRSSGNMESDCLANGFLRIRDTVGALADLDRAQQPRLCHPMGEERDFRAV